jgi:DNA-binding HxlR family transcriptional regulator
MPSYGQYCPVARAAEILNERWSLLILRDVLSGARRYNEIRKGVPRMSPTLLSKRLKSLEACGLIVRRRVPKTGIVEYAGLSCAGACLRLESLSIFRRRLGLR